MSRILCPNCGTENEDPQGARVSTAFCPTCDFPLFFQRGVAHHVDDDAETARNRLPGVAGIDRRAWIPCPACGELNPRDGENCLRCGASLAPPEPEEEPIPEGAIVVIREVLVPAEPERRWPWMILCGAIGSVVTIAAYLLATWIW